MKKKRLKTITVIWLLLLVAAVEVYTMPHGARKWSNVGAEELVYGSQDMAELAARLWSPVTHNREGNILFMESFEHGMQPWTQATGGTGSEIIVSATDYRSSGYSIKMVAGSDGDHNVQIARHFPYPITGRYGLEFSVLFDSTVEYLIWTLAYRDGSTAHQFQGMYIPAEDQVVITIPGGSSIAVVQDLDLATDYGLFHTIKLVGDFSTDKYVRLIINNREYDLSDYSAYTFAAGESPYIETIFTLYGREGYNDTVHIDDVIVTQNEPL